MASTRGLRLTRRGLAAILPLAMIGLMFLCMAVPAVVLSAEPIPPEDSDHVFLDSYWEMNRTGPGSMIFLYARSPYYPAKFALTYGESPASGQILDNTFTGSWVEDFGWGSEVDRKYVHVTLPGYAVWDLGTQFGAVVVFPSLDNQPDLGATTPNLYPSEGLEYGVWGSNDFVLGNHEAASWEPAYMDVVYTKGWSNVGEAAYGATNDDYVSMWRWQSGAGADSGYRFIKVMAVTDQVGLIDPEIDAVKGVVGEGGSAEPGPEPPGPTPPPEVECGWQSSLLERGRMYSDTSLEIDSDNRTHIAFGEEQLYYGLLEGSTWQVERVDTGDVGEYCSLALDSSDSPAISYYDAGNGDLKYAQRSGATWNLQTVDSVGDVGKHTSLAFDSVGRPCISYYDDTNDDLKYAHWNGFGWDVEVVDSAGWVGEFTSLAVDASDNVSISYYDATDENLKYARWNGVAWTRGTVDTDGDVGSYSSLAFDGTGSPAISYHDATHGNLKYAHWSGGSWQIETVDDDDWVGQYSSLAFDSSGHWAISYYDAGESDLKYARWNGTAWETMRIDEDGEVGSHTSLGFNSSGWPSISYYDGSNEALHRARWNGTGWEKETVSGVPWVGRFTSLAFDSNGRAGISYYDPMEGDLKYAYWVGEYWNWEENTWSIQTVDAGGNVGRHTSLAFDVADNPCISYYDVTQGDLKYAHWNGAGWDIETVDWTGDVGSFSSLALDSAGNPAVSYYDATNADVKYCRWNGTGWDIGTVDSVGDVGKYSSLAFDDILGDPAIAYYDATSGDLKYARWNGTTWNVERVDSAGDVGSHVCLAFDCSGVPGMSYHDATNGWLKYAYWGGTSWMRETVDSNWWLGSHTSLVFDASDNPGIAYHQASEGDLRYAHWNGEVWDIETVDSSDWSGRYTSVAFDRCGQPFITYDGATNGDLKYAYIANPAPHQPANEAPEDGAASRDAAAVVLQSSLFSDPCIDSHRASQWQITTTAGDYCVPVFDSGVDSVNLVRIAVPAGVLSEYTTYYWHVRYQDCHGAWSEYSEETSFSTGTPPYQPVNVSPADGAVGVATAPTLVASAFSDPEPGDIHTSSQWQITAAAGDYVGPLFDETAGGASLTQIRVPAGVLDTSSTYYWRVRYQDNNGAWSEFSTETSFTTAAVAQNPPYQPTNVAPSDGEGDLGLTPILQASEFSDPDPGDTHAASHWRITSAAGDYSSPIFDSGTDASNLTGIVVPSGELSPGTAYYWQVRYQDSQSVWSEWSPETSFTTGETAAPAADEGIPTVLVVAATVISIVLIVGIAAPLMLPL